MITGFTHRHGTPVILGQGRDPLGDGNSDLEGIFITRSAFGIMKHEEPKPRVFPQAFSPFIFFPVISRIHVVNSPKPIKSVRLKLTRVKIKDLLGSGLIPGL